jgi:hypothetical protein
MKQPTAGEKDEVILATDIDEVKLDYVYEQLADHLLQLSHPPFDAIGAVSKDSATGTWIVKDRPLTYNTNEIASVVSNYPTHIFPTFPFHTTTSYLQHLDSEHLTHPETQKNLVSTPHHDAKQHFIARHRMQAGYGDGGDELGTQPEDEVDKFVDMEMKQLREYDAKCKASFG